MVARVTAFSPTKKGRQVEEIIISVLGYGKRLGLLI